ncbi:GntR family transcriptional regulator [Embleya sp. NPDC005575]|uniref:GntR family transcriptional regulator n=1 Tax=Embleya sp. NPDC005575 TaxID=3156892 RepID=UPI0033A45A46
MDASPYAPAYVVIAEKIRDMIESGTLSKGTKLPSERELCEEYGVSGITARAAVDVLKNEGLVESRRGSGTYVRRETPLVRIAPERYFRPHAQPTYVREAERAGKSLEVEHHTTEATASADVADRLGIAEGDPVSETRYAIRMGGVLVSTSYAWEPLAITRGTAIESPHEGEFAGKGIVPRFDAIGIAVDEVEEVPVPRMPTPTEVRQFGIPSGVPVVHIRQTFRASGLPVETANILFAGDRYELHYRMEIR